MSDALDALTVLSPAELNITQSVALQTYYWEKKDLASYLRVARTALALLLRYADEDTELQGEYEETAARTAFNIASMAWSGWDEAGITIDEDQKLFGLKAAELNVELAVKIGMPAERRQNGLWVLGAQRLSHGNVSEARDAFQQQQKLLREAGLDEALANSWLAACDVMDGSGTTKVLDSELAKLSATEEGKQQAGYLHTALNVFTK